MAEAQHMHPQLMAAPCLGAKAHPRGVAFVFQHTPVGLCGFTRFMADHLARAVRPIHDQRQIDGAGLFLRYPPDPRDIGLARHPLFKLQSQMALRMGRQRKDHHARGVPIQTMYQQRVRECILHPRDKTIGQMRPLARHRQQARGLVDQQHFGVFMQDNQRILGRIIFCFHKCPSQS